MSNLMQKFLKNPSTLRLISSLGNPNIPKPYLSLVPRSTGNPIGQNPDPFADPAIFRNAKSDETLNFFPSFPFCFSLDPISLPGSGVIDSEETETETESEDSGTVYADSVKKKRKKKMNKHKYKKLRKRLRRKT
ncbi:PREDICTED: uncharacterized protein LOC104800390 [Tarenaya hassleriana]|uniref:uncharacterized protein LOC104800390 n=1 Tax=Tarenaya hassleriana TaxID=28532 RepID=UPI00053C2ADB|nr:PREDICTED: uncharacterized protein LOC104800390 [Tarenaya hassleriana]